MLLRYQHHDSEAFEKSAMNLRGHYNVSVVLEAMAMKITKFWVLRKEQDVSEENISVYSSNNKPSKKPAEADLWELALAIGLNQVGLQPEDGGRVRSLKRCFKLKDS
jgi:hypothetical protein